MLQLQSMVGVPERVDRYEPQYQTPIQPVMANQMRPQDSYTYPSSTPVTATYSIPQRRFDYYQNSSTNAVIPNAPPSPPAEDASKNKLPSISSLLEISDSKQIDQSQQTHHVQSTQAPMQISQAVMTPSQDYGTPESMSQAFAPSVVGGRVSMPSTPPLVPDGPMEGNQSPSTVSTRSTMAAPVQTYYLSQPMSAVGSQQREFSEPHVPKRLSITSQPTVHPYPTPSYTPTSQYTPTFVSSPAMSSGHYYADNPVLPSSGLYSQRPLPSNFPPPMPMNFGPAPAPGSNPWQHHHYISASSQSTYPPSQDRYVCQTCNKAFSRPSSLRIHTYSHTGEKPFKCSHTGCGKAFSVRSNMKRHERGCHAGNNPAVQHV